MLIQPKTAIAAGAIVCATLAFAGAAKTAPLLQAQLSQGAAAASSRVSGGQVKASFTTAGGSATRHATLSGGEGLDEGKRAEVARAIAAVPGVGGVRWVDGSIQAEAGDMPITPMHCQDDVEALLRARTIRFEESSAAIDPASRGLVDEVATALRPCLGSIIAITGHTDASGPEPGNLALSLDRARAVREALVARGIPRDGLRAQGVGSSEPVEGLVPTDPANRRIEFSVIASTPIAPTPVDTPGAR